MDHLNEGQLQAYLDDAVEGAVAQRLSAHLAACAVCRQALATVRVRVERSARALAWLDRPASTTAVLDDGFAGSVSSGAGEVVGAQHGVAAGRIEAHRPWGRPARVGFLKAAMLALFASGAAAAAIPGSPVQRWLGSAWDRLTGRDPVAETVRPAAPPSEAPVEAPARRADVASISIKPVEGTVVVALQGAQRTEAIEVLLVDAPDATVETAASANTRFSTGPSRIQATDMGTGIVSVSLPRSLRHAVVEADGRVLLEKDGATLRASGTVTERSADRIVFRTN